MEGRLTRINKLRAFGRKPFLKRTTTLLLAGSTAIGLLGWAVAVGAATPASESLSLDERLASSLRGSLEHGQLWLAILAAWVGGLLTSFTPCVWPLIPITVRFFGGMKKSRNTGVFLLALVYVLGMMVLYTSLGLVFASSGMVFGSLQGNSWVMGAMAVFCVAMGLSMMGVFSIQLPTGLATRLSQVGGRGYGGALAMGLVSGLIAAPCTGPVLLVILTVVASTGALSAGFWLMLSFSLGLGVPFLVLAVLSGRRIPSGGLWMEVVKLILSTAIFVVAIYFLQLAWPGFRHGLRTIPFGGLGGLILIVVALVAGGFAFVLQARPLEKVMKALTVLFLTTGVSIGAFGGTVEPLDSGVPGIAWVRSHEQGLAQARRDRKPVFIDFTAEWCTACKELDYRTFVDPKVRAEATRFVALKIDVTKMDKAMDALFEQYGILGLPAVIFIDSSGTVLTEPRVGGFVPPKRFLQLLQKVH